jgi:Cu/Ag efflux pump CusA
LTPCCDIKDHHHFGGALALFVLALILLLSMGRSFLPAFNEGALTISAVSRPGISLDESDKIGRLLEEAVLAIPEVTTTSRRTGRGELDEHSQTTNSAEIDINFVRPDAGMKPLWKMYAKSSPLSLEWQSAWASPWAIA